MRLFLFTLLFVGMGSWAATATDGTLGPTSTGTIGISIVVPPKPIDDDDDDDQGEDEDMQNLLPGGRCPGSDCKLVTSDDGTTVMVIPI